MTARMYYDDDADLEALGGQTVAVIGYGSQGHAHAQNLRESGVDVVVGLAPGSKSRALAEEAGLRVADVADAVREADVDDDPVSRTPCRSRSTTPTSRRTCVPVSC